MSHKLSMLAGLAGLAFCVGVAAAAPAAGAAKAGAFSAALSNVERLEATGSKSDATVRRIAADLAPWLGHPKADLYYVGLLMKASGKVGKFSPKRALSVAGYEYRRLMNESGNKAGNRRMAGIYATLVAIGFRRKLLRPTSPLVKPTWALRMARASGQKSDAIRAHELIDKTLGKKGLSLADKRHLARLRLAADRLIGARRALLYPETLSYARWLYRHDDKAHPGLSAKADALVDSLIGDGYAPARIERARHRADQGLSGSGGTGQVASALADLGALLRMPGLSARRYRQAVAVAIDIGDRLIGRKSAKIAKTDGAVSGHARALRLLALTDHAIYLVTRRPSPLNPRVLAAVTLRLPLDGARGVRNPFRLTLIEFGCPATPVYRVSAWDGRVGDMTARRRKVPALSRQKSRSPQPGLRDYQAGICRWLSNAGHKARKGKAKSGG